MAAHGSSFPQVPSVDVLHPSCPSSAAMLLGGGRRGEERCYAHRGEKRSSPEARNAALRPARQAAIRHLPPVYATAAPAALQVSEVARAAVPTRDERRESAHGRRSASSTRPPQEQSPPMVDGGRQNAYCRAWRQEMRFMYKPTVWDARKMKICLNK